MRTLLVLLPSLLGADGGGPGAAPGRPSSAYVEARRAFVQALDRGALLARLAETTRHLPVLEHAGLVRFERRGRRRVYRVEHARLGLLTDWLSWFDRPAAAPAAFRRAWGR